MTTRKDKLEKALAFDFSAMQKKWDDKEEKRMIGVEKTESMRLIIGLSVISRCEGAKEEAERLAPMHLALLQAVEALEMGAFHHPSCGWYNGKDCHCANSKCKEALLKIDKVLANLKEK